MNSSNILDTIRNGDWKDSDIGMKRDNIDSKEVINGNEELDNRYIIITVHSIATIENISLS